MRPQQRSSSVPPLVDPDTNGASPRAQPSASSARTTPMQSPARRLTATIDVNLIPVFSPQVRQLQQQQQRPQQLLEPGILTALIFLTALFLLKSVSKSIFGSCVLQWGLKTEHVWCSDGQICLVYGPDHLKAKLC